MRIWAEKAINSSSIVRSKRESCVKASNDSWSSQPRLDFNERAVQRVWVRGKQCLIHLNNSPVHLQCYTHYLENLSHPLDSVSSGLGLNVLEGHAINNSAFVNRWVDPVHTRQENMTLDSSQFKWFKLTTILA